jgi:hypothetical protein
MQGTPLNTNTLHSQFNIQPINIGTLLANPYPQNPGLSTVTSPITTLTTANHSPRLLGDDQKALLSMYANPAVAQQGGPPANRINEPQVEPQVLEEPPRVLKQIPLPDMTAAGEAQTVLPNGASVKMELETPNMAPVSMFSEALDSKEGMLQHVEHVGGDLGMLRPMLGDEEPAPGKVYIDTALDPLIGHSVATLGTLSYLPLAVDLLMIDSLFL